MGLMPKQTKAEIKLAGRLTMKNFMGIVFVLFTSMIFAKLVHKDLQIPFMIFCVASFLFLTKKAPDNPKQPFWTGLISFFSFLVSRKIYISLHTKKYKDTMTKERERLDQLNRRKESKNHKKTASRKHTGTTGTRTPQLTAPADKKDKIRTQKAKGESAKAG